MTAAAVSEQAALGTHNYWQIALTLAFISGLILLIMGFLRLGALANFLSHSVISGFITASGLLIAASQLKTLMGVNASGSHFFALSGSLIQQIPHSHLLTFAVGCITALFLFWVRKKLNTILITLGCHALFADIVTKAGPVLAIIVTTLLAWHFNWPAAGLKVVGPVPHGLPPLTNPLWDITLWKNLFFPALLISIVGFVESVSVGQTLAAKRRERIEPNQELIALGACNVSASLTGGFPVTGGFARSVVNADSGAQTPAAGLFTAVGIALAALFLTPALFFLPQATLAATIIVAVLSLIDINVFKHTWRYSKTDFAAMFLTLITTLSTGVEIGLITGVAVSLVLHLYKSSQPHIATVGLVPSTEYFRNIMRHTVLTHPEVLCLRIDEILYFANARSVKDRINAEVKGPVMDRLKQSDFLIQLSGQIFLTNYLAVQQLSPSIIKTQTVL